MSGFQTIVADRSGGGGARVDDGSPALQTMVVVVMEQIGNANGDRSAASLDCGKSRVIVDDGVVQKDFIAAAAAKIESGEIIEGARGTDGGEQEIVLAIPEVMVVG